MKHLYVAQGQQLLGGYIQKYLCSKAYVSKAKESFYFIFCKKSIDCTLVLVTDSWH